MSENGVYPQWNSHLIGIMISKTIGYNGVHYFQTHPCSDVLNPASAHSLAVNNNWVLLDELRVTIGSCPRPASITRGWTSDSSGQPKIKRGIDFLDVHTSYRSWAINILNPVKFDVPYPSNIWVIKCNFFYSELGFPFILLLSPWTKKDIYDIIYAATVIDTY